LYRSLLRVDDDRISEGPYVTGFSMTRLARKALRDLYPDRIVEGLRELSAADADLLRASWEQY
jgi:hypothetical protein